MTHARVLPFAVLLRHPLTNKAPPRSQTGRTMTDPSPAQQFIEAIPHSRALGMQLESIGDGVAVISMPYNPALIGDPATGVIAGGAVWLAPAGWTWIGEGKKTAGRKELKRRIEEELDRFERFQLAD